MFSVQTAKAVSTALSRENSGFILAQMKSDFTSDVPQDELFTAMDPYKLGIRESGDGAVPLIKTFVSAAEKAYLNVVRHGPTKDYNAITYEILCAGICPDILGSVKHQEVSLWDALLTDGRTYTRVRKP